MILGNGGAERFGDEMIKAGAAIKDFCESWGRSDEFSPYVQAAVGHAVGVCRGKMDRVPALREYLLKELLGWPGWDLDLNRFRKEASETILHPLARAEEVSEHVRRFVCSEARLGDPRLFQNQKNWAGIRDAEIRVKEWLSQFDIVFFFQYVLPHGQDPHGRKQLWLKYVSRVKQSRPLLNNEDKIRLLPLLRSRGDALNFGRIEALTSAFLLNFGSIVIVEFSKVGNA